MRIQNLGQVTKFGSGSWRILPLMGPKICSNVFLSKKAMIQIDSLVNIAMFGTWACKSMYPKHVHHHIYSIWYKLYHIISYRFFNLLIKMSIEWQKRLEYLLVCQPCLVVYLDFTVSKTIIWPYSGIDSSGIPNISLVFLIHGCLRSIKVFCIYLPHGTYLCICEFPSLHWSF